MLDVTVIVYLDDILIYSDNLEDHKKHVREVLHRLRKHGLSPDVVVFDLIIWKVPAKLLMLTSATTTRHS